MTAIKKTQVDDIEKITLFINATENLADRALEIAGDYSQRTVQDFSEMIAEGNFADALCDVIDVIKKKDKYKGFFDSVHKLKNNGAGKFLPYIQLTTDFFSTFAEETVQDQQDIVSAALESALKTTVKVGTTYLGSKVGATAGAYAGGMACLATGILAPLSPVCSAVGYIAGHIVGGKVAEIATEDYLLPMILETAVEKVCYP